jgi:hypothetical protein
MVITVISSIQTLLKDYIKTTGKGSGLAFVKQLLKAFKPHFPNYRKMKPNALAMFMDPSFKAILLLEDEVKLAIDLIEKEINEHIPDPQSQGEEEVQENSEPSSSL